MSSETHIIVGFSTKRDDWISRLICWFTRWRHSHVVLISSDCSRIIESTGFPFPDPEDGEIRDGVREVPIGYFLRKDVTEIRKIAHPNPALVWEIAQDMAKRKMRYDHKYYGAWLLNRGDGDANKVSCNELIEIACALAGKPLYPEGVRFTTPRDLYLISEPYDAKL